MPIKKSPPSASGEPPTPSESVPHVPISNDPARLAYSVAEFCTAASVGRSKVYEAISCEELKARKAGRRTIILHDEGEAWLRALPRIHSRTRGRK
jgi:hypothetical protein